MDNETITIQGSTVPVNECHTGHDSIMFHGERCPWCEERELLVTAPSMK